MRGEVEKWLSAQGKEEVTEEDRGYRILVGSKLGRRPRLATELVSFTDAEGVLTTLQKVL